MYADFDTLTKMIAEVSPQAPAREAVTGLNLMAELKKLRSQIDKSESIADFGALVRAAITLCQDGHTSLVSRGYYKTEKEFLDQGVSPAAIELLPKYDSLFRWSANKKLNLRLKYLQGEYYNVGEFSYNNILIPAGWKLVKCNGVNIHQYVKGLYSAVPMMRWDFTHKRYFAENFFDSYHLTENDTLHLTFQDKSEKDALVSLPLSAMLSYAPNNYIAERFNSRRDTFKTVSYFPEAKLLYIRVPRMNLDYLTYYPPLIQQEAKEREVKKVVIDIRNNPGGADNVWVAILRSIIAKPINYQMVLLCNNSPTMRTKFPKSAQGWKPYPTPFLKDTNYGTYYVGESSILPDSNSIGFDGPIYVIQNENIYSSAGALAAVAGLSEKIVSVGSPTGKLLGRGVNPLMFELPYSKILYRIEPVIDFMNVANAEDVFHDKVDIPIELTIDEYLDRIATSEELYSSDYLLRKDPVFKKVATLNLF